MTTGKYIRTEHQREKHRQGTLQRFTNPKEVEKYRQMSLGKRNPNFRHGKYAFGHTCKDCDIKIDGRSKQCVRCRMLDANPFKGKHHSVKSKKIIGIKSKAKFTPIFLEIIRIKHQGRKKRAVNGYTLIKDYKHPNRNSHNDVLEHIKVMVDIIGRPLKKGEIVHHKNFIRNDNRRRNLWLYKSMGEHGKLTRTLFKLVDPLLRAKVIKFKNGGYIMNKRLFKEVSRVQTGGEK